MPVLFAQNNPPAARLRSLNNHLLGIYSQLLSSPAGEAIALRSRAAQVIQERAALLGEMIETDTSQAVSGASVTFTLTRPDTSTTTKAIVTGSNGQATWSYKINPKAIKGTYTMTGQTTYGSQSATASAITFTVQ